MHDGRQSVIHLLDGRKLELVIQPRLMVGDLLNLVASHVPLKDPDKQYFGIAYVDELYHYHWLSNDRRVLDYELPRKMSNANATIVLFHSVKLFVDSVLSLSHPATVELYFLDTKTRLQRGLLQFSDLDYFNLASNLLQIYDGDYTSDEIARNSLSRMMVLSNRVMDMYDITNENFEKNVINMYKGLVGTQKGLAILNFMQIAERSPTYGSHFYRTRDKSGQTWMIAINNKGIYQYENDDICKPKKVFYWSLLDNLYYKDKKFSVEVRDTRSVHRIVHSLNNLTSALDVDYLDPDDDLARAVNDPTTQYDNFCKLAEV